MKVRYGVFGWFILHGRLALDLDKPARIHPATAQPVEGTTQLALQGATRVQLAFQGATRVQPQGGTRAQLAMDV